MVMAAITIIVGAVIGFVTNLLAIVMLFRPWREWRILGVKVPFTPGLIPKRQAEIAKKLGEVVETHLLTEEAVQTVLSRPEWVAEIRSQVMQLLERVLSEERTLGNVLRKISGWTSEQVAFQVERLLSQAFQSVILGLESKQLRDVLSPGLQQGIADRIGVLALEIQKKTAAWLDSTDIKDFISQTIQQMLLNGGMLGKMAVMFVNEEKLTEEMIPHLKKWADSLETLIFIESILYREWDELLHQNAVELLQKFTGRNELDVPAQTEAVWDRLTERMLAADLLILFEKHKDILENIVNTLLVRVQQSSVSWLTYVMRSLQINQIVERQIASFPLPKLEFLVVSIVKKELQMITWLGALLGGLIALVQVLSVMRIE
ncbi:DUF445 family protein [Effusibacillus dendaii]|uniref:UPF0754 membrane protein YheB n=1 Tax=Effusibacillus dendaii TaxID=2743772 RepID=A0A7I8DJI4_9BACL|nr:DUF445 family protein [Effusibacillus dendaii]BCJ88011.1 UPF0754 membrane protein YheB [Effusibacillus dendaii]